MNFSWRLIIIIERKITHREFIFHPSTCVLLNSPHPDTRFPFCHFFLHHPSLLIKGSLKTETTDFFSPLAADRNCCFLHQTLVPDRTNYKRLWWAWKKTWALRIPPSFLRGTGRTMQELWGWGSVRPLRACLHRLPLNLTRPLLAKLLWRCPVPTAAAGATAAIAWWDILWWSFLPSIYQTLVRARPRRVPKSGCQPSAGEKPARERSCGWGPWLKRCTLCATICPLSTAKEDSPSPRYRRWNTPSSTSGSSQTCWTVSNRHRCPEETWAFKVLLLRQKSIRFSSGLLSTPRGKGQQCPFGITVNLFHRRFFFLLRGDVLQQN